VSKKTKTIKINIPNAKVALAVVGFGDFLRLLWPAAKTCKKDAGLGCGGRGESEITQPC